MMQRRRYRFFSFLAPSLAEEAEFPGATDGPPYRPRRAMRRPWMIRVGSLYFSRMKWLLLFGDLVILWAVLLFSCVTWYGIPNGWRYALDSGLPISLTIGLYLVALYVADFYNPRDDYIRARKLVLAYAAGGVVTLLGSSVFYFLVVLRLSRAVFMIQLMIAPLLLLLWRFALYRLQQPRTAVILGSPSEAKLLQNLLQEFSFSDLRIAGTYEELSEFQTALPALREQRGLDLVIHSLACLERQEFLDLLATPQPDAVEMYSLPELYEWLSGKVACEVYPPQLLVAQLLAGRRTYRVRLKRIVDVVCSLLLLLVSIPILLLCAVLIKLNSNGPVFYRQARVGTRGRSFYILKLRTMTVLEAGQQIRSAQAADLRVTAVGRWLRIFHLDEIPQLINVLRGEMAFVGPRPWVVPCSEQRKEDIPLYSLRTLVPQGITGWAQVNCPYPSDLVGQREALAYDLYYIKNFSLLMDLRVLLRTVRAVLSKPSR